MGDLVCTCETCGRTYFYDYRRGHTKRKCNSCRTNARVDRRALKRRLVEHKGGACQLCGYSSCLQALTFHHVDPETKAFNIAPSHQRSWLSLLAEVDKCILVCSNCHKEIESGATAIPREIGNPVLRALKNAPRFQRRRSGRPATDHPGA